MEGLLPNTTLSHYRIISKIGAGGMGEVEKARGLNDDPAVLGLLAHAYAGSGKREEAMKVVGQMHELARQCYVSVYSFAVAYAGLGDKDQAF